MIRLPRFLRSSSSAAASPSGGGRTRAWIAGGALVLLVLAGGSWLALGRLRATQLIEVLDVARAHREAGDLPEAARLLMEARRAAPQNVAVIRAIADFQTHANAPTLELAQTLKHLVEHAEATDADLISLASVEVRQGAVEAARQTLGRLSPAARATAEVIELEAAMLKLEGRHQEAEDRLRTALLARPGDPQAALKLAVIDYKQPLTVIHHRGREALWKIARHDDDTAASAIQLLTKDIHLTPEEAERLAALAEAHPAPGGARLAALGALAALRPQERAAIIQRESARAAAGTAQERQAFAQWLTAIGGHEHLPAPAAASPAQARLQLKNLPPDQLHLRLEALAEAKRWDDLSALLIPDAEKILGTSAFHLWQARLAAQRDHQKESTRHHLRLAFETALRDENLPAARQSAETAARLAEPGLAALFYEDIAAREKASPRLRADLLEKAFTLHASGRDTAAMLRVARQTAELTPASRPAVFRSDYLALLAGESLEVIAHKMESGATHDAAQRLLLRALASHRLHQPIPDAAALKDLKTSVWPAGQRAVLAALIATTGDTATAFQIAERISPALLLPEEARLLRLAQ